MAIVWNHMETGAFLAPPPALVLNFALYGTMSNAFSGGFILTEGDNIVVFHGSFTGDGGGGISDGTITGFDIYFGDFTKQLASVTGYSVSFAAYSAAMDGLKNGGNPLAMIQAFFGEGMTVNGANQFDFSFPTEELYGSLGADHIYGNGGSDQILDMGGDDFIYGGGGGDEIVEEGLGQAGNDVIYGGDGDDTIAAGGGNDFISGGNGYNTINGQQGVDTADYSEKTEGVTVNLNGPTYVDVLVDGFAEDRIRDVENINGGLGNDSLTGDGLRNVLSGNLGNDKLFGGEGDDALAGGGGRDRLDGGAGADTINGGEGRDVLKGGADEDTFVFDFKAGKKNADKVKDFSVRDDTIALDDAIFANLDLGALKAKFFYTGNGAHDGNDRIIYDDESGGLFYDKDGSGGAAAKQIAQLDAHLKLGHQDILVI